MIAACFSAFHARHRGISAGLIVSIATLVAAVGCERARVAEDEAAVRGVVADLIAADNQGDLEAVMRHYGSDPVLMPPGRDAIVGREAVRDHYGRLLGNVDMAIEAESLETVIAGDWAIDRGVTRGRVTTRGGGDRRLNDRYLMLLRRDANGSWKISRLIWHEGPAGDGSQADALRPIDAVIRAFLEAADSHEWNRMSQVITPDHLFSLNGYEVRGEGDLKEIWQGWWDYAPEFHSEIVEIVPARDPSSATVLTRVSGPGVVRDGEYIEHEWSFPVAALVVVREGRVAEWREFYDASEMESIGEN